jgi:transposase
MAKSRNAKYSNEFKREAVKLSYEIGATKAARQLGIHGVTMSTWRNRQSKEKVVSKQEQTLSQDQEIKQLRKENEELKKVNYILKRAAAFFSQDHLK